MRKLKVFINILTAFLSLFVCLMNLVIFYSTLTPFDRCRGFGVWGCPCYTIAAVLIVIEALILGYWVWKLYPNLLRITKLSTHLFWALTPFVMFGVSSLFIYWIFYADTLLSENIYNCLC